MRFGGIRQIGWLVGLTFSAIGGFFSVARGEALFVRGAVTGTWGAPIDTVVIDSMTWVPSAETLFIAPGMVVAFSGRFSLVVNGTLLAEGTAGHLIKIQRRPYHDPAGHLGIRFRNTATISRLRNAVFEDGFANLGDAERYGGALELHFAEVEIDSCLFRNNRARIDGGAIYCREAATLRVRDSFFHGDSTRFGGGGAILARTSGSVTLERCRFAHNKAVTSGGAVVTESGVTPRISECEFRSNKAYQRGGAIQLRSSPPAGFVSNCVIFDCDADQGGGLYLDNSRATIEACSIRDCGARIGGGLAARGSNNTTAIARCVISENSAWEDGGGMYFVDNARCVVSNSLITNNEARRGGAAFLSAGTAPVFRFATVMGNNVAEGTAFHISGGGHITNSIIAGSDSLLHYEPTATTQITYTDVCALNGTEVTGFAPTWLLNETRQNVALIPCDSLRNISRNPLFVDYEAGDLRLRDDSPCLFGADTSSSSGLDMGGYARVAPLGSWPDMGAFENAALLPYGEHCGLQRGVWYPGDYIIGCTLRVAQSDTLVIMGGSKLLFAPGASLLVEGTLLALGSVRDSILFDRYIELPGSTWGGISLHGAPRAKFDYCTIRRVVGTSAVRIEATPAEFSHCLFSENQNANGAGALHSNSNIEVRSCRFTNNIARTGAAMAVFGNETLIEGCEFENNTAVKSIQEDEAKGGAVFAGGQTEILRSRFAQNEAFTGGAVYLDAPGRISECVFDSCRAHYGGAAALVMHSNTIIERSQFRGNFGKERGGAVFSDQVDVEDRHSEYVGNRSLLGGAVAMRGNIYSADTVLFRDNSGEIGGGALILTEDGFGVFTGCELTRNHALDGGGVHCDSSGVDLEFCVIDSNYAARAGGGIYMDDGGLTLRKTTCVNQRSGAWGSVIHARGEANVSANSTLFAENGEAVFAFGDDVSREFLFCMGDSGFANTQDSLGFPARVNFNADSCDTRFNLIADPEFVNLAGRNYQLKPTSAAVHAGDSLLPQDDDGTRADIGRYSGTRPYALPSVFNVTAPHDHAEYSYQDTISFAWNAAFDDDPGDTVRYFLRFVSGGFDYTLDMDTLLRADVNDLWYGEYVWWVEARSQRPETPRRSFGSREIEVVRPQNARDADGIPGEFGLEVRGPNPFNAETQLRLSLPHSGDVSMIMHDVLGREVRRQVRSYPAGVHAVVIDGSELGSGILWVSVQAGEDRARVKLLLVK